MATYEARRYNTPVADASKIADGSVNNTEFQHLDGVTSDIQSQFTGKLPLAGGTMTGDLNFGDNVDINVGAGTDLKILHDGSNSTIKNTTGTLKINADTVQFKNEADNATFLTLSATQGPTSLQDVYPVGSIYMNATNSANPSSLLGFGTWVTLGAGRMPINDGGGFTAGNTGGATTHTISESQLPSHTHSFTGSSSGTVTINKLGSESGGGPGSSTLRRLSGPNAGPESSSTAYASFSGTASGTIGNTGSGSSVDHMNPYIVVYMWKRTA